MNKNIVACHWNEFSVVFYGGWERSFSALCRVGGKDISLFRVITCWLHVLLVSLFIVYHFIYNTDDICYPSNTV